MTRRLVEGSEAIAEAMIAAGCRFFAGYPMTPFTEVLEHMAAKLPDVGGTCMNAESELEAIGMVWGASATGTRAATGSTGQGLALMQESIAELAMARLPAVILDLARGQGDYFQATRGGGHGDYRTPVLAPCDVTEAVELVHDAFDLADTWRNPVVVLGDYYLAHTSQSVEIAEQPPARDLPVKEWALDGHSGGTGAARLISPLGERKQHPSDRKDAGYDLSVHYLACAEATSRMLNGMAPRFESDIPDHSDLVVVAYGTPARYIRAAVDDLRSAGHRVGWLRPITLLPFPATAIADAARRCGSVAVYENSGGQLVDDVRLAVLGAAPVHFIGRLSLDASGFGIAPDLDVRVLRDRIRQVLISHPASEAVT